MPESEWAEIGRSIYALGQDDFKAQWMLLEAHDKRSIPEPWFTRCAHRFAVIAKPNGRNGHDIIPPHVDDLELEVPGAPVALDWPPPIDLRAFSKTEPQSPQFIINDWMPAGYMTLIAGHGGVGKSGIALQVACAIALGLPFAGINTQQRRVLYLSCEDRADILHWRLKRLCDHAGYDMAKLHPNLDIVDLVGHDAMMWSRDRFTGLTSTPAFARLLERVGAHRADVVMVDGISDTYGGGENTRNEVKQFCNAMLSVVPKTGALALIGHVDKVAATNGATSQGYSGSTGWHNSARARWYLYPETDQEGERPTRTGRLLLELQKSNNGRMDQSIGWRWDDDAGLLIPEDAPTKFDAKLDALEFQRSIASALVLASRATVTVPAAMTGPRTAFHVLSAQPGMAEKLGKGRAKIRRFWAEIENMRALGFISDGVIARKDRHKSLYIYLTEKGMRECGQ